MLQRVAHLLLRLFVSSQTGARWRRVVSEQNMCDVRGWVGIEFVWEVPPSFVFTGGVGDFTYFHFVIFFFSFLARFSGVCSKGRNARNLALSLYYLNNINPHLLNALKIKSNGLR